MVDAPELEIYFIKISQRKTTMSINEEKFWNIIEEIDWPNTSDSISKINKWLHESYYESEVNEFHFILAIKKSELEIVLCKHSYNKIGELSGYYDYKYGVRGWDDMLSYIISMGKEIYYEIINENTDRAKDLNVKENFSNIFSSMRKMAVEYEEIEIAYDETPIPRPATARTIRNESFVNESRPSIVRESISDYVSMSAPGEPVERFIEERRGPDDEEVTEEPSGVNESTSDYSY